MGYRNMSRSDTAAEEVVDVTTDHPERNGRMAFAVAVALLSLGAWPDDVATATGVTVTESDSAGVRYVVTPEDGFTFLAE